MTGEKCHICNKFMERGDNPEWNNAVEIETTHDPSNSTYYFFLCQDCAEKQKPRVDRE